MKIGTTSKDLRSIKINNWEGLSVKIGATTTPKKYFNSNGHAVDHLNFDPLSSLHKEWNQLKQLKADLNYYYDSKITINSTKAIYNLMTKKSLLLDQAYNEWKTNSHFKSDIKKKHFDWWNYK